MQGNDSYRLVVRRGPQPNQVYELTEDVTNLGRDITNDIVINDREVSRHHLRLMRGAEGHTIEDLGSTNGTFVNGKRISGATPLNNGDLIALGETVTLGYERVRPEMAGGRPASAPAAEPRSEPAPPERAPYQPPPRQEEPEPDPYQPPRESYPQPRTYEAEQPYPQEAYSPPQQDPYYAAQASYGPPPPGYDYDPYAMREDTGPDWTRLVLFGCLGLMLFCCCITIIAWVAIDQLNLYCSIPILNDVLEALGLLRCA